MQIDALGGKGEGVLAKLMKWDLVPRVVMLNSRSRVDVYLLLKTISFWWVNSTRCTWGKGCISPLSLTESTWIRIYLRIILINLY